MNETTTRYGGHVVDQLGVAPGWSWTQVAPPSSLVGANGLVFGPDGDLYVAEGHGSEISAINTRDGSVRNISRSDDPIECPDDLAFGADGTMYVTEFALGRVSMRHPGGEVSVLDADVPSANGVTTHGDRVFVDEFRPGGRIMELYPDGRERRVIAEGVDWPNGLAVGPDYHLYYPSVFAGELWKVGIDAGSPERVASGLSSPTAVKFSPEGELYASLAGGDVLRVDPRSGSTVVVASLPQGSDNLAFRRDGWLFVSNQLNGSIVGIDHDGASAVLISPGLVGPFGIDVAPDGTICAADALSYAVLSQDGVIDRPASVSIPGFPGVLRSVTYLSDGRLALGTTAGGIAVYRPGSDAQFLAKGINGLMGITSTRDGAIIAAASESGEILRVDTTGVAVLATGLARPMGVAVTEDGGVIVSESGSGQLRYFNPDGSSKLLLTGLGEPHGVAASGDDAYVIDRQTRELHHVALSGRIPSSVIAKNVPVGPAAGVGETIVAGLPGLAPGPWLPFADLAIAPDGSVVVGCDGSGGIIAVKREPEKSSVD